MHRPSTNLINVSIFPYSFQISMSFLYQKKKEGERDSAEGLLFVTPAPSFSSLFLLTGIYSLKNLCVSSPVRIL